MPDPYASRLRFRPFGVVGSVLEIMIGLAVLRSVLWTTEDYAVGLKAAVAVMGAVIVGAGVVGLTAAAHRRQAKP